MKILIAVDGSTWTKEMLAYLAAHDEWLGNRHEYTVLHVVAALPLDMQAMLSDGPAALERGYVEQHDKVFEPIRTFFRQSGIEARFVGKTGPAAELIAEEAQRGRYDLLMMGSRGHGALAGLLFGSVTTKVLALCKTPVLLIR